MAALMRADEIDPLGIADICTCGGAGILVDFQTVDDRGKVDADSG
jgi:hypothetical protein